MDKVWLLFVFPFSFFLAMVKRFFVPGVKTALAAVVLMWTVSGRECVCRFCFFYHKPFPLQNEQRCFFRTSWLLMGLDPTSSFFTFDDFNPLVPQGWFLFALGLVGPVTAGALPHDPVSLSPRRVGFSFPDCSVP